MAGFGTLAHLDFNQLDLRVERAGSEALFIECAVVVAAAEIPRAYFPDQITAVYAVM